MLNQLSEARALEAWLPSTSTSRDFTAFSSGHSDQQHCPDMDVLEHPVWAQAAIEPRALILLPS